MKKGTFFSKIIKYKWMGLILFACIAVFLSFAMPADRPKCNIAFTRRLELSLVNPRGEIASFPATRIAELKASDLDGDGSKEVLIGINMSKKVLSNDARTWIQNAALYVIGPQGQTPLGWECPRPHPDPREREDIVLEEIYEIASGYFLDDDLDYKSIFFVARDNAGEMRLMSYFHDGRLFSWFTPEHLNNILRRQRAQRGLPDAPEEVKIKSFKGMVVEDIDGEVGHEVIVFDDLRIVSINPIPPGEFFVRFQKMIYEESQFHEGKGFFGLAPDVTVTGEVKENFITSMAVGDLDNDGRKEIVSGTSFGSLLVMDCEFMPVATTGPLNRNLNVSVQDDLRDKLPEQIFNNEAAMIFYENRRFKNLVIADIDADDINEVIFAAGRKIYIFELRDGKLVQDYDPVVLPAEGKHFPYNQVLFVGNFNRDARLEICCGVYTDKDSCLYILQHKRTMEGAKWEITKRINPPHGHVFEMGIIANILNNDEKPELLLYSSSWTGQTKFVLYENDSRDITVSFKRRPIALEENIGLPIMADLEGNDEPILIFGDTSNAIVAWRFPEFVEEYIEGWHCMPHDKGNTWCYPKGDKGGEIIDEYAERKEKSSREYSKPSADKTEPEGKEIESTAGATSKLYLTSMPQEGSIYRTQFKPQGPGYFITSKPE